MFKFLIVLQMTFQFKLLTFILVTLFKLPYFYFPFLNLLFVEIKIAFTVVIPTDYILTVSFMCSDHITLQWISSSFPPCKTEHMETFETHQFVQLMCEQRYPTFNSSFTKKNWSNRQIALSEVTDHGKKLEFSQTVPFKIQRPRITT